MNSREPLLLVKAGLIGLGLFLSAFSWAQTVPAGSIDGTWRWTFIMPDGTTSHPKLILETEEGQLTGTSSFRPGNDVTITNATLAGNEVRFQVIRARAGRQIVTTYAGVWNGRFIRGQIVSNWAGQNQTYPWEAERAHEGAEGVWKWSTTIRGRKYEARVRLAQDGERLTGWIPGAGRGPRRIHIKNGSIKNGEVSFEVERGAGANAVLSIYRGKQTGETINGTIETVAGGKKAEVPGLAGRAG
jgi:hypothetical protein